MRVDVSTTLLRVHVYDQACVSGVVLHYSSVTIQPFVLKQREKSQGAVVRKAGSQARQVPEDPSNDTY